MQSGREIVKRAIKFDNPERIPICSYIDLFTPMDIEYHNKIKNKYPNDFLLVFNSDPEYQKPLTGEDEWGCIWKTNGNTMGEVVVNPLDE